MNLQEAIQFTMEASSGDKKAYNAYFDKILKKFGAKSPSDLKDEDMKKFYDEVDKGWDAENETD